MRTWKCRKCGTQNPRKLTKCQNHLPGEGFLGFGDDFPVPCPGRKPAKRVPAHRKVLDDLPYEWWVEEFGERCGICTREPSARRRLDRDHWHNGPHAGEPRGLLCFKCNRALPHWVDAAWLEKARRYLEGAS